MLPLLDDAARPDLRSLGFSELSALVSRLGEQPYRARQLYSWLHRKGAASLDAMTDLPRAFRERLAAETRLTTLASTPSSSRATERASTGCAPGTASSSRASTCRTSRDRRASIRRRTSRSPTSACGERSASPRRSDARWAAASA